MPAVGFPWSNVCEGVGNYPEMVGSFPREMVTNDHNLGA